MREYSRRTELLARSLAARCGRWRSRHAWMRSGAPPRRSRDRPLRRPRAHHRGEPRESARDVPSRRPRTCVRQVSAAAPLRESRAAGGRQIPHPHGGAAQRVPRRAPKTAMSSRSTRCRRSSRDSPRPCSALTRSTATSPRMREPLKYSFRLTLTLVLLLAMLAAHLRRDLLGAAPGAPGAGPDRRHPRRRQGRFRYAPAAALAR